MQKLPVFVVAVCLFVYVQSIAVFIDKKHGGFLDYDKNNDLGPVFMTNYRMYPYELMQQPGENKKESTTFPIMQAPLAWTNPVWGLIRHASSIYRAFHRNAANER